MHPDWASARNVIVLVKHLMDRQDLNLDTPKAALKAVAKVRRKFWHSQEHPSLGDWKRAFETFAGVKIPATVF